MSQHLKQLGKNGPMVNPLGLGCMGMSEFYGAGNDEESIRTLEHAIKQGCTFWDTANVYGNGKNERLISRVLKENRDKVFIGTKFGFVRNEKGDFLGLCGKPDYVRKCCEESLERLGIDYIDLYYQHRVDPDTPIEETVQAMAELVKEGKVRYLGLSECSADELRRAYKVHPITAVQMEYSPWTLDIEQNGLLEAARELGVAVVCFCPLGRGFLIGAIKSPDDFEPGDFRRTSPRYMPGNFEKNLKLVDQIKELAAKKGVTPSQFVLAWILAQGPEFFVIPGTKRIKYLDENLGALDVKLTPEEIAEMRKIVDEAEVHGPRYNAALKKLNTNAKD